IGGQEAASAAASEQGDDGPAGRLSGARQSLVAADGPAAADRTAGGRRGAGADEDGHDRRQRSGPRSRSLDAERAGQTGRLPDRGGPEGPGGGRPRTGV